MLSLVSVLLGGSVNMTIDTTLTIECLLFLYTECHIIHKTYMFDLTCLSSVLPFVFWTELLSSK